MIATYVRNDNNNIVMMYGSRNSFRCRQREYTSDGLLNKNKDSLRFISFKDAQSILSKGNKIIYGPLLFNTMSRM